MEKQRCVLPIFYTSQYAQYKCYSIQCPKTFGNAWPESGPGPICSTSNRLIAHDDSIRIWVGEASTGIKEALFPSPVPAHEDLIFEKVLDSAEGFLKGIQMSIF